VNYGCFFLITPALIIGLAIVIYYRRWHYSLVGADRVELAALKGTDSGNEWLSFLLVYLIKLVNKVTLSKHTKYRFIFAQRIVYYEKDIRVQNINSVIQS